MKRILVITFIFIYILTLNVYATNSGFINENVKNELNIDKFLEDVKGYVSDVLPELNEPDILEKIIAGDAFDAKNLINRIGDVFIGEIKTSMKIIFTIIGISLLCSVIKNIQSSFGGNVSEIAFYVCYLFIVILIINTYTDIISVCRETIINLNEFMNMLIPLILSLLVVNGNIVSVGMMQPVLLVMITVINTLVSNFILPIIFISTMINIVSNISENIEVSKIPKLLQKASVWMLEFILIIFVGILSLEGTLAANVDGLAAKTAKTVVSTVIPVVGKALSDATDSIIGATSIMKNAIGIIGVIVIVGISIIPIIKVLVMMIVFNVSAALIEPIVDKRISKCMNNIGDSIKIVFALMSTICVLFIIATTIMIKVGNVSLMYR